MTNLLINLFIKDKENIKNIEVRGKYGMVSSVTGIIVNILLSILKLIVGIVSNSMSIISDALNNVTDAGSSVVTMIGFKMSQKEVDSDHPWGHGRMEYITAFIVDILIILVGIELFQTSIEKIIHPVMPEVSIITIILLVIAILVKLWLFIFYRKIANIIDSSAIRATAYDSISDSVSTILVLVSIIVARFAGFSIDGYASILVSIFILFTGFNALKETVDILLGGKPDEEFVNNIIEFVKDYPMISGIHDIMVHDYGPGRQIVSFHAEVPADCDICKAHDVIDGLEQDLYKKFKCITTIHMDPIVVNDERINEMKEIVKKIVSEISEEYSIHDFRLTDGGSRVNLIFDLVIPRGDKSDRKAIENEVKVKIHEIDSKYYAVIKIEHSFV
ncbi:MAG: cation transporter [Clostridia bacterium]|nr:cation transporter [Clostridia bacterium]